MILDEEVEEFLEHHGVKGQKWGVRNTQNNTNLSTSSSSKKKKLLIGAGIGAVAIGSIAVGVILKRKANIKINTLNVKKVNEARDIINKSMLDQNKHSIKIKNLLNAKSEGRVTSAQSDRLKRLFERDYMKIDSETTLGQRIATESSANYNKYTYLLNNSKKLYRQ